MRALSGYFLADTWSYFNAMARNTPWQAARFSDPMRSDTLGQRLHALTELIYPFRSMSRTKTVNTGRYSQCGWPMQNASNQCEPMQTNANRGNKSQKCPQSLH